MNKHNEKLGKEILARARKVADIQNNADRSKRPLTEAEESLKTELELEMHDLKMQMHEPCLTMPNTFSNQPASTRPAGFELRAPHQAKDYEHLFGASSGPAWQDTSCNFFAAVLGGRHHPGLVRNSMNETVPSDGGFLVPTEYASRIHAVSLENEIVMPRCFVQPMKSNEIKIPAMAIGDHSGSLYGGFTASYKAELATIDERSPKARSMTLNAKKLTGLIRFSSELASDIPGGEGQVVDICGKGLSWYRDKAFLKGTGGGEPLGILNADCTIEVDPEEGQAAATIVYENLTRMMAAMWPGSFGNAVWICHQSTIPQLLSLSVATGESSGTHIPVMTRSDGGFEILTRPVFFCEKTEPLGNRGDVLLADLSQYVVGLRSEMRFDVSIHALFSTDELLARLVERHDGQPLWDQPLTLEDGVTRASPFVILGTRK